MASFSSADLVTHNYFFFFSWLSFSISVTVAGIFKFVPLTVAG